METGSEEGSVVRSSRGRPVKQRHYREEDDSDYVEDEDEERPARKQQKRSRSVGEQLSMFPDRPQTPAKPPRQVSPYSVHNEVLACTYHLWPCSTGAAGFRTTPL